MVLLIKNGILPPYYPLKQFYSTPSRAQEGAQKDSRLTLVKSIQIYSIQFEAFRRDFVEKEWISWAISAL